ADALVEAARRLEDLHSPEGRARVAEVAARAALSREMAAYVLERSAQAITHASIERLRARVRDEGGAPLACVGVVLAANVTTAALRALAVPLALGTPVLLKASSRDDVVARAFIDALSPACAARVALFAYEGGDT